MIDNIFSSLKNLGFLNFNDLELYKKENLPEDELITKDKKTEIDINSLIYDKKITCPICSKEFTNKVVKVNAPRIQSKDSDFHTRYANINPLFYEVWICPYCGYSALKRDFHKIKSYQKSSILLKVSNNWKGKDYPDILNETLAIERYKLALLSAIVSESKNSTRAYICLKIAWMYRLLDQEKEEKDFLNRALEGFILTYKSETTPIYGLDKYSLMYLIGELYRRTGDIDNACAWFSNVIVQRNANYRIREKAREMRNLCK